jgi:hypothetical protein
MSHIRVATDVACGFADRLHDYKSTVRNARVELPIRSETFYRLRQFKYCSSTFAISATLISDLFEYEQRNWVQAERPSGIVGGTTTETTQSND